MNMVYCIGYTRVGRLAKVCSQLVDERQRSALRLHSQNRDVVDAFQMAYEIQPRISLLRAR